MTILFVTLFPLENNTSVSISNYGLLKGLQELGHKITILMPHMDSNDSYRCDYDLSMFQIERIPGLSFNELRTKRKKTIWNRIRQKWHKEFDFLDFTSPLLKFADQVSVLGKYYDIIISTSDPKTSHVFVKKLTENGLQYGRWIQHWGDPLNGDITRRNCYPDRIVQWYERRIIRDANKIIYVSPFTAEQQRVAHISLKQKINFVPLPCIPNDTNSSKGSSNSSTIKLAYLGDYFSNVRNIMPLYEACKKMEDVELIIAGISNIALQPTKNITVLPRIPHSQAQQIEEQSDVSVSICNMRGTQIPGKLYYSAAMQKHLLVLADGDNPKAIKDYLKQFNRYMVTINNETDIEKTIQSLRNIKVAYECPEELKPVNVAKKILE